jgi:Uma2 family endonuclease
MYCRHGVREYVVWRVLDQQLDWFVLQGGTFEPLAPDAAGILRSPTFPGLWLDPAALLCGDMQQVLAVVQQGLASPEHVAFVQKLQSPPV